MIYTSHTCRDNGQLIEQVLDLYAPKSDTRKLRVADVTWGKGVFWRNIDLTRFDFHKSDILTVPEAPYDFRALPYTDQSFDLIALDPPYAHNPGKMIVDANYRNAETTRGMYHNDIINLYRDGMREAYRVLCKGGHLLVKCQDEVESSFQRWSHIEILRDALDLGFYAKDLFVLTQSKLPHVQFATQQHARKNHSYLWVFRRPEDKDLKSLNRYGVFNIMRRDPNQ